MTSLDAGILHLNQHSVWGSRRLWSLADMINFALDEYIRFRMILDGQFIKASGYPDNEIVPESYHDEVKSIAERIIFPTLTKLQLADTRIAANNLQDLLSLYIRRPYRYGELTQALNRLRLDANEACKYVYFFHCPSEMAKLWFDIPLEWGLVLSQFPSSKREIEAGTDCYAFGDYTGCIFHMMRMAELDLRAIARERGIKSVGKRKPLEYGTWQDVFQSIEIN